MSAHVPKAKNVVQETPDPLINLGDTAAAVSNEKRKRGMLSTFMGNSMGNARSSGFLANLINKQSTLGSQVTD